MIVPEYEPIARCLIFPHRAPFPLHALHSGAQKYFTVGFVFNMTLILPDITEEFILIYDFNHSIIIYSMHHIFDTGSRDFTPLRPGFGTATGHRMYV